jgi:D-glycero-alpha-D-manno-heptose-7-phosphate kinase
LIRHGDLRRLSLDHAGHCEIVIVRTPVRVSFFGGGTDYPDYYLRHGGQTLATSIDKYGYITLNALPKIVKERFRINYSRHEACNAVAEIRHPAVRACLEFFGVHHGINLNYTADLPGQTGLGSSSSFTVGLIHALHAFHRRVLSKEEMALLAIHIEQDVIPERVGSQDQYICATGGLRRIRFERDGLIHSDPIYLPPERLHALEASLMLFHTHDTRLASQILDEQVEKTKAKVLDQQLVLMNGMVDQGRAILEGEGSLDDFGHLLHEGWEIKRRLSSKVSNASIDESYRRGREAGAVGGKLLGAGGGGFLLFYVPVERQDAVRAALADLVEIPFRFDFTGTSLLYLS